MKKTMKKFLLLLLIGVAATACTPPPSRSVDEKADVERVREAMQKAIPNQTPDAIRPSAMSGLYEVSYGSVFIYVSGDGRFAISGDLVDLSTKTSLTEQRRTEIRAAIMNKYAKDAIVYAPKGETRHVITVFTDLDCGYCRKLHSGMKEMNELGLEVRYLSFPRSGPGSPSFKMAVSVWCAKDQKAAMDKAKSGANLPEATCANTVAEQYAFGQSLGVQGTPAIFLQDGRMIPGYVPPQQLLRILEEEKAK